jgi:SAM-dependent methyltransferase
MNHMTKSNEMPPSVNQYTCRICGNVAFHATHRIKEMMFGSREEFEYFECRRCSCLQIAQIPDDLERHYPNYYYSQAPRREPEPSRGAKRLLLQWYCRSATVNPASVWRQLVRSRLPVPGDFVEFGEYLLNSGLRSSDERILDVGCGASPYRLAAFHRCGFERVEGIDPFVKDDLTYHGVPVRKTTIAECSGTYGLIMFHHSLEHVPDPRGALASAARLLRPGGTCLVRVPVFGTYFWRRFGVNWVEIDAPRHLYLMAPETIGYLANETGFRVRKCYFDSAAWEVAGSLRYERGLPLRDDPQSSASPFTKSDLAPFQKQVEELNRLCTGGRACFYLDRI